MPGGTNGSVNIRARRASKLSLFNRAVEDMPIAHAGRFEVDYADAGDGPAVVLVHSSASGNRQWRRLADELAARNRVIAVNLFGYGATTPWPAGRPMTLGDAAALVVAVADRLPAPVALVGHSLGAAVALEAALRLGKRAATLIAYEPILFHLLEPHGFPGAATEIYGIASGYSGRAATGDWAGAGKLFVDYWSGAGAWAAMPDERRLGVTKLLPCVVHEFDAVLKPWRTLPEWSGIAAQTHVMRAADTRAPTHALAWLLSKANPRWRLHEIPAGGHMAPVARPDLVNPLLARVLDEQIALTM
jgi:pimeloyl-ACP methyl ester carboxylesterase